MHLYLRCGGKRKLFRGQMRPASSMGAAIEAGRGRSLTVLSSPCEHPTLVFCCFFLPFRALCFKKLDERNTSGFIISPHHLTISISQCPPAVSHRRDTALVPLFWTISEVSHPSEETVTSLLSSMPSAAPLTAEAHAHPSATAPPPRHRGLVLLVSKGTAHT